jgi:hypothetical protein
VSFVDLAVHIQSAFLTLLPRSFAASAIISLREACGQPRMAMSALVPVFSLA